MNIEYIILVLAVILVSMTLHEAMHAFMSYWLGDDTAKHQGRLTLNPLKHIDPFLTIILPLFLALMHAPIFGGAKPVPFDPTRVKGGEWGAALVALAGPLTNLLIAFLAFGIGVVTGVITGGPSFELSFTGLVYETVIGVNLGFFIFNMIPIPPLDGSRVMYALAPEFVRRGMEAVERFGLVVVFGLVLLLSPVIGQFMGACMNAILAVFEVIFRLG